MGFLDKYEILKKSIPVPAVSIGLFSENCEMVDMVYSSKNCQYCFDCYKLENGLYCTDVYGKKNTDCLYVLESELCYECVDCNKCYGSTYLLNCNNCTACHFCAFCVSCSDCFGCAGLTHKSYCIFNQQYTKEDYLKKLGELKKEDSKKIFQTMIELKKKIPHPASHQLNNENCPYGDYIYNSKDSYWCFNCYGAQDCGFVFTGGFMKKSWDVYFGGTQGTELCYEVADVSSLYNCTHLFRSGECTNCHYSSYLLNCSDCFGCVGLGNKKYCILNNQLTKEQYEEAVRQIKSELGWKNLKPQLMVDKVFDTG